MPDELNKQDPKVTTEFCLIPLSLLLRMGTVNYYLIRTAAGFLLIDSGSATARKTLLKELENSGNRRLGLLYNDGCHWFSVVRIAISLFMSPDKPTINILWLTTRRVSVDPKYDSVH